MSTCLNIGQVWLVVRYGIGWFIHHNKNLEQVGYVVGYAVCREGATDGGLALGLSLDAVMGQDIYLTTDTCTLITTSL